MIVNTTFKRVAFLSDISRHLVPGHDGAFKVDSTDPASGHEFIYFGGGYWRGVFCSDGMLSLVNPDRTREEIAAVEAGVAVLMHCTYRRELFSMGSCPDCKHEKEIK